MSIDRSRGLLSAAIGGIPAGEQRHETLIRAKPFETRVHLECHDPGRAFVACLVEPVKRILPRASDLWVPASLDYKQRLQPMFFPEGIAFDGNRFNRTAATAPLFQLLGAVREC